MNAALPATNRTKVLLVEDNEDHATLIHHLLTLPSELGEFSLKRVARLAAAEPVLKAARADVVLLDLFLSDSAGLGGLEKVLKLCSDDIPVVVLTSLRDDAAAVAALQLGAEDYLLKDLADGDLLVRTIRLAIQRHGTRRALKSANAQLAQLTLIDPLTGLLNRRGLQQALDEERVRSVGDPRRNLVAMLLDLDDFKSINDHFGHAVGDVALKETAHRLRSSLRSTDHAARIGGDEFMILLPETSPSGAFRAAEKVRLAVCSTPMALATGPLKVTASIGMAHGVPAAVTIEDLLACTHLLLQRSKSTGKNRVSYDGVDDGASSTATYSILDELRQVGHFRTVMQPIYRLRDHVLVGHEFLSRSTVDSFEMPAAFFRLAVEADILSVVDLACLRSCVLAAARMPPLLRRHVNLFPSTAAEIPAQQLVEILGAKGRGVFCVELSEQQIVDDPVSLTRAVIELRKAGVLIAIDDIGFGRSSLESLVTLEPDIVKIDKRCSAHIAEQPNQARIVRRLLDVAAALHVEVVLEGIEREEDLRALVDLGVEYGQGFLLGEPVEVQVD